MTATVTDLHPLSNVATQGRSYNCGHQAARVAAVLNDADIFDARDMTSDAWDLAARPVKLHGVALDTRRAVEAILDVQNGILTHKATGEGWEREVYNRARVAARVAEVFIEVGLSNAVEEVTASQWRAARQIAKVGAVSEKTKEMVLGILAAYAL